MGSRNKTGIVEGVEFGKTPKEHNSDEPTFVETIIKASQNNKDFLGTIPYSKGKYEFNKAGDTLTIDPQDTKFWTLLYDQGNKITGNGEVALYWLLNCKEGGKKTALEKLEEGKRVQVGQSNKGIRADLKIDDIFTEVKAYTPNAFNKLNAWARLQQFTDYRSATALLFAVLNLIQMGKGSSGVGELKYTGMDLKEGAEKFCLLRDAIFDNNLGELEIFKEITASMEKFDKHIKAACKVAGRTDLQTKICYSGKSQARVGGESIALAMIELLIVTITNVKPGPGGMIINIPKKKKTQIEYLIPKNLDVTTRALQSPLAWEVAGGSMKINFGAFFK